MFSQLKPCRLCGYWQRQTSFRFIRQHPSAPVVTQETGQVSPTANCELGGGKEKRFSD